MLAGAEREQHVCETCEVSAILIGQPNFMNERAYISLKPSEVERYNTSSMAKKLYRRRGDALNSGKSDDLIVIEYALVEVGRYTKREWRESQGK